MDRTIKPLIGIGIEFLSVAAFGDRAGLVPAGQEIAAVGSFELVFAAALTLRGDQSDLSLPFPILLDFGGVVGVDDHRSIGGEAAAVCIKLDADSIVLTVIDLVGRLAITTTCCQDRHSDQEQG